MTISSTPSKYFVATSAYLLPLSVLVGSALLVYFLYFSSYFQIKKLTCMQDVNEPCQNAYLLAELDQFAGQNLFLANTEVAKQRLLQGDPTLRTLTYKKTLPHTLSLELQSVYPTLALAVTGLQAYLTLDSDLRLIKASPVLPNVPLVRANQPISLRLGERVEDERLRALLLACLELAHRLPGTTTFTLSAGDITALLDDGVTRALFTLERDLESQISALHATRAGVTISFSRPLIDLRFTQPIIKDGSSL